MNLQGSITDLQEKVVQLYLELEHHFKENQMIRDLWGAMAHDVTQQKRSMNVIPPSFWHRLKAEQDGLAEAISDTIKKYPIENKGDSSLRNCFERALLLEEPIILKVYVPVIRKLRENWTDQALDFYIMVKAHLARITRVTQSFAGDPIVIQRSNMLLERFEKDVQEPQVAAEPQTHKVQAVPPSREKQQAKPKPRKAAPQRKVPVAKHAKTHHKRTKPLVEEISLQRRRARR